MAFAGQDTVVCVCVCVCDCVLFEKCERGSFLLCQSFVAVPPRGGKLIFPWFKKKKNEYCVKGKKEANARRRRRRPMVTIYPLFWKYLCHIFSLFIINQIDTGADGAEMSVGNQLKAALSEKLALERELG